ncbi:MAG: glycoside hydrolase family 27 protein [Eubacterium sp.]|nr:glycoside hydrolase family 27 protein [Eubacterium sp.]
MGTDFKNWAKTPPRGWNSWDCFGAAVNEEELKANADYMAENLKKYGWEYIVCDIQWYEPNAKDNDYNNFCELVMDEYGRLIPAPNRFPSSAGGKGFKPIADYIHSLGLKFGIHIMRGVPRQAAAQNCKIFGSYSTCRDIAHHFSVCSWNTDMYGVKNCEASQEYYNSIINMYASWGVDFIKCDDISVTEFRKWDNPYTADYEIEMLRKAIDNCGREIVLSLSPGPAPRANAEHLSKNANMWRLTGDFWDQWDKLYEMFDKCREWQGVGAKGNYPDCDMLPIGRLSKNGTCHGPQNRMTQFTKPEQFTLMTLWGIFRSPLMIGGNLPENDEFTLSLLTNKEYLKMHDNSYGAKEIFRDKKTVIWSANGGKCKYIAIFNTDSKARKIKADLTDVLMPDTKYLAHEIWSAQKSTVKNRINCEIEPHGAKLYLIK